MLDVLLAFGADLNAKSRWWAGGFGLLHGANPDVVAYAMIPDSATLKLNLRRHARRQSQPKVQGRTACDCSWHQGECRRGNQGGTLLVQERA
jgi:hypothetical protein